MAGDKALNSPTGSLGRQSPSSPTLLPPRKSVELEDSGTHDLDSSSDADDVFSDAREGLMSPQVPLTRVEKVDDAPSHGQVPGTDAYEKRLQDAVPDEVEIVPEGSVSRPTSRRGSRAPSTGTATPIPRTVVEKIDPESPSHGEVPGTHAYQKRLADAVPDRIANTGPEAQDDLDEGDKPSGARHGASPSIDSIPKTVVTRVDSVPSYGEVPGRDTPKSSYFSPMKSSGFVRSPIAEDGGFGPMDYDGSEESGDDDEERSSVASAPKASGSASDALQQTIQAPTAAAEEDAVVDDFDDFEEGEEGDDFGDFDEAESEPEPPEPVAPSVPISVPMFDIPDLSDPSLESILSSTSSHFDTLFPSTSLGTDSDPPSLPTSSSTFLTDRSMSLWSQLVAPPPLQPPNWVRSRIRRLFLVSLGVPVDLDEILPASKQKKLVLNYTSGTADEPRTAASRLRDAEGGGSDSSNTSGQQRAGSRAAKKRKGPPPPPEFDMLEVKAMCATTSEALDGMSDSELKAHVARLEELVQRGREVLQYWVARKDAAVSEKEAFDGVIENLVQHARRTRK